MASSFNLQENNQVIDNSHMTVSELKAVAKELDITGYYSMTKAELIEAIKEANNI